MSEEENMDKICENCRYYEIGLCIQDEEWPVTMEAFETCENWKMKEGIHKVNNLQAKVKEIADVSTQIQILLIRIEEIIAGIEEEIDDMNLRARDILRENKEVDDDY